MSSQVYPKQSELFRDVQPFSLALLRDKFRNLVKRVFDFTAALVGLIFLAPVFVYIALLIKKDSPGPVFFWGMRMGKNGKPFRILKFRTMYESPESYQGPKVTGSKDNRITPLGHWLRNTKINELPQLWNVLIGEMSLVGPRPEDVDIAKMWPNDAFYEILSVSPGITSPASVLYHDEEQMLSKDNLMGDYLKRILPDKIRLDRLYVRHHAFFSDIDAIFWTIAIILPQLAKTKIPEGYIFAGPISRLFYRYVNWFVIDFVVSLAVAYAASSIWGMGEPDYAGAQFLAISLTFALLFSGFNAVIGLDRVLWSEATVDDGIRLTISSIFMTFLIWILQPIYRLFFLALPSTMLLFIGVFAGFGFLLTRYRLRLLSFVARRWVDWRHAASNVGERVLIVGFDDGAKIADYLLRQGAFRTAFSVVGTIDNMNPSQHGMRVSGHWLLGGMRDIPALIKRYDIGLILSTIPHHDPEIDNLWEICQDSHTKLIFLDDLLSMTDKQITRPQGQVDNPIWVDGHLEYKSMHDVATGLPNRYLLQDRLKHTLAIAKRNMTQPMVIFVEFRKIRDIVDTMGNKVCIQIINELVQRLETCKRESDTLARFGFDKFAFLVDHVPSDQVLEMFTKRIEVACAKSFSAFDREIYLTPKIGFCSSAELEESDKVDILRWYGCAISKINEIERDKELAWIHTGETNKF